MNEPILAVSDFVAVLNQSLEYAYPSVAIVGELANLRISKGRWLYFDLKDEHSSVKFFGTNYQLPGPLEDGMMLQVRGKPRLHQRFGFSVNVLSIQAVGEGSLRRAAALLEAKLKAEGLFNAERKRPLPLPPRSIGLITSGQSAAYADFIKILNERWVGLKVFLADVQVQGEPAPAQLVAAIEYFNSLATPPEVLVMTRGGGSAEDLAAFNTETVTRAVAASRVPTMVAIGHENDISLAELAADLRASTPSNAVQLLVPDRLQAQQQLLAARQQLGNSLVAKVSDAQHQLQLVSNRLAERVSANLQQFQQKLALQQQLLAALNPRRLLDQGYSLIYSANKLVKSISDLKIGQDVTMRLSDGQATARITKKGLQ